MTAGYLLAVASNEEPHPEGGVASRHNLVVVDFANWRVVRITSGELAYKVAVAGNRVFATTYRDETASNAVRELVGGALVAPAELGVRNASELAGHGDHLVWTDAGDQPLDYNHFPCPNLRSWTVGDAQVRTLVADNDLPLWSPSVGPNGQVAALEMEKADEVRAPRATVVVVGRDGTLVTRIPLRPLGRLWLPEQTLLVFDTRLIVNGRVQPSPDESAVPALAVLDVETGQPVEAQENCVALAVSPDRARVLLGQQWSHCFLTIATGLYFDYVKVLGAFPLVRIRGAVWVDELPPGIDVEAGVPADGEVIRNRVCARKIRRTVLKPAPAPRRRSSKGIVLHEDARDRLDSYGGSLYVQILEADDRAAAARALAHAHDDLMALGTPARWAEEGWDALPSLVREVEEARVGPCVCIDAGDTDNKLLRRIPAIVRRHLKAEGVTRAVIAFPREPDGLA